MSSLDISRFLKPMKRKEETPLSFKSLNAQINAMMLAICLVEDKDSRIQFMKRIEVVQRDLYGLRSELESDVPSTKTQNVRDVTQRIDGLSEGLALVIQRHRHRLQANEDQYLHSDYHRDSDPYTQDKTAYSKGTDKLNSNSNYSFEYSHITRNSDGHQVQISINHARRYHHPSSNYQAGGYNQFTPGPNHINSPQPININHYDRFSPSPSSFSQLNEDAKNHSRGYSGFTGYPGVLYIPPSPKGHGLNYFSGGRYSQYSGPSSQTSSTGYPSNRYGYPRKSPRATGGARNTGFTHYT